MNDIEEIWKILAEKQNIIFQTQSNSVIFKSQEKQMLTEDRYKKIVEFLEREGSGLSAASRAVSHTHELHSFLL